MKVLLRSYTTKFRMQNNYFTLVKSLPCINAIAWSSTNKVC